MDRNFIEITFEENRVLAWFMTENCGDIDRDFTEFKLDDRIQDVLSYCGV